MTYPTKKLVDVLERVPKLTSILTTSYLSDGKYPIVDQGQSRIAGYTNDSSGVYKGNLPVVIFGDHTRALKFIDFPFAVGADGTKILKPVPNIDVKYFYNFLQSVELPARGYARHFSLLKNAAIPVPPIAEQRKIVEKIEKQFAKIDEAEHLRSESQVLTDQLFPAALHEIFSSVESKGWEYVPLSELATDITDGDHMPPPKSKEGVPFITISNIDKTNGQIDFSDTFKVPKSYYRKLKANRKPNRGDVLYSVTGSFGIPVVVESDVEFCFQRHIGLIRPTKKTDSRWLYYLLKSPQVMWQAKDKATGLAQKTVSLTSLRSFMVPNVELKEQKKIVDKLDLLSEKVRKFQELQKAQAADLKSLKQSILHEAFT